VDVEDRVAQFLDGGQVILGMNFLRLGSGAEKTGDFAVAFLVGLFRESGVAGAGVGFALERGTQVFNGRFNVDLFARGHGFLGRDRSLGLAHPGAQGQQQQDRQNVRHPPCNAQHAHHKYPHK
jgi:hypothetical protein